MSSLTVLMDGKSVYYSSIRVLTSLCKYSYMFNICIQASYLEYENGAVVQIFLGDKLLIDGVIEIAEITENNQVTYTGRNKGRYIVEEEFSESYQFMAGSSLAFILDHFLSDKGILVKGDAVMPSDLEFMYLKGDRYCDMVRYLSILACRLLFVDAYGNIVVDEPVKQTGKVVFDYGSGNHILGRSYVRDDTKLGRFCVSTNSSVLKKNSLVYHRSDFGELGFNKSVLLQDTVEDCQKISEYLYERKRKASRVYKVKVRMDLDIDLNTIITVKDESLGRESMLVRSINYYVLSKEQYKEVELEAI